MSDKTRTAKPVELTTKAGIRVTVSEQDAPMYLDRGYTKGHVRQNRDDGLGDDGDRGRTPTPTKAAPAKVQSPK